MIEEKLNKVNQLLSKIIFTAKEYENQEEIEKMLDEMIEELSMIISIYMFKRIGSEENENEQNL